VCIYIYIYIYIYTHTHTYPLPEMAGTGTIFSFSFYFSLYSKTFTIPFNAMDPECVMLYLHSSIRFYDISRDNFYGLLSANLFQHTLAVKYTFGLVGYGVVG
jgi:hypothetical protein